MKLSSNSITEQNLRCDAGMMIGERRHDHAYTGRNGTFMAREQVHARELLHGRARPMHGSPNKGRFMNQGRSPEDRAYGTTGELS